MKTPKSLRLHIGIFGKTNVGKSSFLNKIAGQNVSIVSDIKGTTTDVVEKSMELFPIGPVTFLDTAGINDETELAQQRIEKTLNILPRCDVALLLIDFQGISDFEKDLITKFQEFKIPFLIIINKYDTDQISAEKYNELLEYTNMIMETSSLNDNNILDKFIELLIKILP